MAQVFAGKSGSNIRWQLAQILVDIYISICQTEKLIAVHPAADHCGRFLYFIG